MKGYAARPREMVDSSWRTAIYVTGTNCFNKMHSQSSETKQAGRCYCASAFTLYLVSKVGP